MIIRIFETAVTPDDVERGIELFRERVRPVFTRFEGCRGIDLHVGLDEHSADLVNFVVISRWTSLDDIDKAAAADEYAQALTEIRGLFQQTPIVRHFELVD